ncbi:exported hypothetical protein [Agrobacterium deltaense RV3]|nr:exported hypothetical protein [Agrobacterium deltaense RV3]
MSLSAAGFLISRGAFAFSWEEPGPPCRILAGVFVEVDIYSSCRRVAADKPLAYWSSRVFIASETRFLRGSLRFSPTASRSCSGSSVGFM